MKSISFRTKSGLLTAVACVGLATPAHAVVTLSPSSDTYIFNQQDIAGSRDSVHGSDSTMLSVNIGSGSYNYFPLLHWDLSSYTGQTVIGDASLQVSINFSSGTTNRTVQLVELPEAFSESTTTFNNYNPAAPETTRIGTIDISGASASFSTPPSELNFTLPEALIQGWIDNPSSNFGIGISMSVNTPDVEYHARESVTPAFRPTLSFTVVPEPSSTALLGLGGLALMLRRKR